MGEDFVEINGVKVSTQTGMQPANAPTPTPANDLKTTTNVETEAILEEIKEATEDGKDADNPNGPQATNLDNVTTPEPPIIRTNTR